MTHAERVKASIEALIAAPMKVLGSAIRDLHKEVDAMQSALDDANAELERERIRLAACGVVALSNTPESAAKAREMLPEYRSASCDDVARAVDREMQYRIELADAVAKLAARDAEIERLRKPEAVVRLALLHAAFDAPGEMKVGELREAAVKLFGAQAVDAALSEEVKGGV